MDKTIQPDTSLDVYEEHDSLNEDAHDIKLYPEMPADYYVYAAACVAANIKIISYELGFECKGHMDFDVVFEFQYKSRGNYVWGRTMEMIMVCPFNGGELHDYPYDGAILREVYKTVRKLRKNIEGDDPGYYQYLVED